MTRSCKKQLDHCVQARLCVPLHAGVPLCVDHCVQACLCVPLRASLPLCAPLVCICKHAALSVTSSLHRREICNVAFALRRLSATTRRRQSHTGSCATGVHTPHKVPQMHRLTWPVCPAGTPTGASTATSTSAWAATSAASQTRPPSSTLERRIGSGSRGRQWSSSTPSNPPSMPVLRLVPECACLGTSLSIQRFSMSTA